MAPRGSSCASQPLADLQVEQVSGQDSSQDTVERLDGSASAGVQCPSLCDTGPMADQTTSMQHAGETAREEALNVSLEQLLRDRGLAARAERRSRGDAPDLRFEFPSGELAVIECKWEDGRTELEAQLTQRIDDFPNALARVGVLYPNWLKQADDIQASLGGTTELRWFLHSSRATVREPSERRGDIDQLANDLRTIPLQVEGYDIIRAAADEVGYAVEQAARAIDQHANVGRRIADVIGEADKERDRAAALRIGCLVLFNALAFEERLAAINESVPTASEMERTDVASLREAWQTICHEIDYVPVFELASDILEILEDAPTQTQRNAMTPLYAAVRSTQHIEGHDLSGRIFHTLLSDAKFTGAYYTSIPAATILARLVFDGWPTGFDWSDHELPSSLNVADLACGTGTLLMAVAAEAERRHLNAGGQSAAELHKMLVEEALYGFDVQLSAIHFAATSLAMLNPQIEFDHVNLYVMPLGAEDGKVSLGSLDFLLDQGATAVQHSLSDHASGLVQGGAEQVSGSGLRTTSGGTVALPPLDLAIMNPPFTRPGKMLFGMLPAKERKQIQQELNTRLKNRQGTANAGLGASFVATATPKLHPNSGRMALVLPITLCTGSSWQQTRSLIERYFNLDLVIASHDPEGWFFSDSTDLSEVLLIATRRDEGPLSPEHRTTYVNLWRNPKTVVDALQIADAVAALEPAALESTGSALLSQGDSHVGEAVSVPMSRFAGGKWNSVQFSRVDLLRSALALTESGEVRLPGGTEVGSLPICQLSELASLGPDRRRLIDGFDRTDSVTSYPMVEGHETEERARLTCEPNKYLSQLAVPRGGQKPGYGDHLWRMAASLLIAERLRLDTARVVAMRCQQPVLSNVWWETKLTDDSWEKSLMVFLNSSLGVFSLLSQRTTTEGGWVSNKKGDLGELAVLDPRSCSPQQLAALDQLFDEVAEMEFLRLPEMAECPARRALDDGLSDILDLPDLSVLRTLLASEPVVSNRRL